MKVLAILLALVAVVLLAEPSAAKPVLPPEDVQAAAKAAADEYKVPLLLLYAVLFVETGGTFATKQRGKLHGGNCKRFADSYRNWRDRTIPGSAIKWGDKFKLDDWRPWGISQVMPYNLWGVTLDATAPLTDGFDLRANLRAGARVLRRGYESGKSWIKALAVYNAKPAFRDLVLRAYRGYGGNSAALEGGNS